MKYVIAKGTFGLGGRLAIFISAYEYAKRTNRILVVDWNDSVYYDGTVVNCYAHLFAEPKALSITEFDPKNKTIYPRCWANRDVRMYPSYKENYNMLVCRAPKHDVNEDIVVISRESHDYHYEHLYKLLKPTNHICKEIEEYRNKFFKNQYVVGVHIRSGNGEPSVIKQDTEPFHNDLKKIKFTKIFLATDSPQVLNEFRKKYGDKLLIFPKKYPKVGNGCFHRTTDKLDRKRIGEEAVIDMWLLKNCRERILTKNRFFDKIVRHISQ